MSEKTMLCVKSSGERLDKYVAANTELTRSRIKNAIISGEVLVNGKEAKPSAVLKEGDIISVELSDAKEVDITAEDLPLQIVYEDADLAVINKPQGMVVHPAPGNYTGTLVNAVMHHVKDLSGINGQIRPGIVHRIDKETSGLLVVAKNDKAHLSLAKQIKDKTAQRIYYAIVHGNIKEEEIIIDKPIARSRSDRKRMTVDASGREAVTIIRVKERFGDYTLVEAELKTGRTHQIRVHLASIQRPVAGDKVYGPKKTKLHEDGQLLHAGRLKLIHPSTGQSMVFNAPLPVYFEKVLDNLRAKKG